MSLLPSSFLPTPELPSTFPKPVTRIISKTTTDETTGPDADGKMTLTITETTITETTDDGVINRTTTETVTKMTFEAKDDQATAHADDDDDHPHGDCGDCGDFTTTDAECQNCSKHLCEDCLHQWDHDPANIYCEDCLPPHCEGKNAKGGCDEEATHQTDNDHIFCEDHADHFKKRHPHRIITAIEA